MSKILRKTTRTVAAKAAAEAKVSAPAPAPAPVSTALVPAVKAGAMSVHLGPKIAQLVAKYTEADINLQKLKADYNERDYTLSAMITEACVAMTLADPSIDFAIMVGKDTVAKTEQNKRVYYALGLKKAVKRGKPGKEETVFDWDSDTAVGQLLGENDKDTAEIKDRKQSYRTNLSHKLTQCQKAALFLIENKDIKARHDDASGTLMLTGPGVQKLYGAPTVLLNQAVKQPLRDADGNDQGSTVNLKAKPSYTDLARRAAEAHGKVSAPRVTHPKQFDDAHAMIVHQCDAFIKMLEKYSEPNDAATKSLESLMSAIEEVLG